MFITPAKSSHLSSLASLYNESDVSITARISDLDRWNNLKNISRGVCYKAKDNEWYVTARVPSSMLDELQKESFVISLKVSEQVGLTGTPSINTEEK